jgi:hypothetical protein
MAGYVESFTALFGEQDARKTFADFKVGPGP